MPTDPYPDLGYDPCPGDQPGYQALAVYAVRSATMLGDAVRVLAAADSQEWRGQAASAFRAHLDTDVLPLARTAVNSVERAAMALRDWEITLRGLQDEAKALDRQAAPWREQITVTLRAAGLPATATPPYPSGATALQTARLMEANVALQRIAIRAENLHAEYLAAVQRTGSQLDNAGNMAPHPPGLFSSLWHDAASGWDTFVRGASEFVHDQALWEFLSGVANIIATVSGLLALIPPLSAIFGPIALIAAGVALISDVVLAAFDHGSWSGVLTDALALVCDAGWMKSASKLREMYTAAGLEKAMTKAPTWAGLVSKIPKLGEGIAEEDRFVNVAPGMFKIFGSSLKEGFAGKANAMVKEVDAITSLDQDVWRPVDIACGLGSWAFSAESIAVIPGNVHNWVKDIATGKSPWQQAPTGA
jgi:hypothetical protein